MQARQNNKFHLGDILTVLTGWNLSLNGWDGACQLMDYMLGKGRINRLYSNGVIEGAGYNIIQKIEACKPYLLKQFPQFNDLKIDPKKELGQYSIDDEKFILWLNQLEKQYGSEFGVKTIKEFNANNTVGKNSIFANQNSSLPITKVIIDLSTKVNNSLKK